MEFYWFWILFRSRMQLCTNAGWVCSHPKGLCVHSLGSEVASSCAGSDYHHACLSAAQVGMSAMSFPWLENLAIVTHALTTSSLVYCNALCLGLPLKVTQKSQLVQNAAAWILTRTTRFCHVTPIVQVLHWLLIVFCAQFKMLVRLRYLKAISFHRFLFSLQDVLGMASLDPQWLKPD